MQVAGCIFVQVVQESVRELHSTPKCLLSKEKGQVDSVQHKVGTFWAERRDIMSFGFKTSLEEPPAMRARLLLLVLLLINKYI